jgi:hypothetical protein
MHHHVHDDEGKKISKFESFDSKSAWPSLAERLYQRLAGAFQNKKNNPMLHTIANSFLRDVPQYYRNMRTIYFTDVVAFVLIFYHFNFFVLCVCVCVLLLFIAVFNSSVFIFYSVFIIFLISLQHFAPLSS